VPAPPATSTLSLHDALPICLHPVLEAGSRHVGRHLGASAEFVDEGLVEPRLVDLQVGIGEQAVTVEPLDVVSLERAPVAPDVDVDRKSTRLNSSHVKISYAV